MPRGNMAVEQTAQESGLKQVINQIDGFATG
jgi:hypothetical protein